jgi:hypothetical protein
MKVTERNEIKKAITQPSFPFKPVVNKRITESASEIRKFNSF